jgi:hypothetical protein
MTTTCGCGTSSTCPSRSCWPYTPFGCRQVGTTWKILASAMAIHAFLAGIIRYGEGTWALKCSSRNGLRETRGGNCRNWMKLIRKGSYIWLCEHNLVCLELSAKSPRSLVWTRRLPDEKCVRYSSSKQTRPLDISAKIAGGGALPWCTMIYTEAVRPMTGVILRCIRQVSMTYVCLFYIRFCKQQTILQ